MEIEEYIKRYNTEDNMLSIANDAISPEKIPMYPRFDLKIAKKGDTTFDIHPDCKAEFGDGRRVDTVRREAEPGEVLRNADLKMLIDTTANLKHRGLVIAKCKDDPVNQEIQKIYCRSNILYYINTFCWITEPGSEPIPFISYDFQDNLITWVLRGIVFHESLLLEKSRKVGATWMMRVIHGYLNLFNRNNISLSMSMNKEDVDNFTTNSLFGKQRCIYDNHPLWMRGGWEEGDKITDKQMYIGIPDNNSYHEGALTGGSAKRGGRVSFIDYDEFAHIQMDVETTDASVQLADAELFLSTCYGMDNEFARMAHDPAQKKMRIHWTENPLLDWKWALRERGKSKYTEDKWNTEMEITYSGSVPGKVYPKFMSQDKGPNVWSHVKTGKFFDYDPALPVDVGIDFGIQAPNSLIFTQTKQCPSHFENEFGSTIVCIGEAEATGQTSKKLADMIHKPGYNIRHYVADMYSAVNRDFEGHTLISLMAGHGIHLVGNRYKDQDGPISCVRRRLEMAGGIAFNPQLVPWMITCMQQWGYPVDKNTGIIIPGSKAKHNKYSHMSTALFYLVAYLDGYMESIKTKKKAGQWKTKAIRRAMV